MASFCKRSGKWSVQIRKGGHSLFKTFQYREDAHRWAREHERLIDLGEALPSALVIGGNSLTVRELLGRYELEVTPKKRSASSETYLLRSILRHNIAELKVSSVTQASVAEYRDHRLTQVTASTVRRELAIVQHAFNIARREWGILAPDLRELSKPKANKARDRRLNEDDLKSLSAALSQCRNKVTKPAVLFAIATGMRRGEVLSLRWSHIDLEQHTAFLEMTKNGDSRTVPLSPSALLALKLLPATPGKRKGSDYVFQITGNALRLSWEKVKRRASVTDLRFHDLRHEAISRFFEMGLSMPEVSLISGHRDPRMLFRYTHLRATDVAEKLRRLSESETPEAADPPEET
jgi:integrase